MRVEGRNEIIPLLGFMHKRIKQNLTEFCICQSFHIFSFFL